ncbi:MAG: hypothetical protein KatS3mg003_1711 [Candidatus Nitrosocaldaceae archaeon]|nr:MAG: hypothetical protein KatS3mg003_1711 [Candidatus Nitrosocaldaceae archaeon]
MRWQSILPVIAIAYIIAFFSFASGLFNGILEGNSALFITRQRNVQTLGEVVLGVFIFIAGTAGFYLIHKAGERRIGVNRLIIAGFSIIALALIASYALVVVKF